MSTFLAIPSAAIAGGSASSPQSLQTLFANLLTSNTWQIKRQAVIGTVWTTGGNPFSTTSGGAMQMRANYSGYSYTSSMPAYLGINYASGFTPTAIYVMCDPTSFATYAPKTFTLDYSDNGSSWTTLATFSSEINWTSLERRKYIITGAASHAYWRINVTAPQSGSYCSIYDFVLEDTNGNWLTTVNFFDCIPPSSETIGNAYAREFIRWTFPSAGTSINFIPMQELLTAIPQLLSWDTPTAGAVTLSITINGSTVSYTGITANTALQNARGLYEACVNSVNANFTAMYWYWPAALVNIPNGGIFYAIQKTPAMNILPTSSNITTRTRGTSVVNVPAVQGTQMVQVSTTISGYCNSLTIDPANGWIYYLQICSRGLALASKTNSGYYSPIHMVYGDSASSLAQLPTADLAAYNIPCTPIELFIGSDYNYIYGSSSNGWCSHWWGILGAGSSFQGMPTVEGGNYYFNAPFSHHVASGMLQDCATSGINSPTYGLGGNGYITLAAEGISQNNQGYGFTSSASYGNNLTVHKMTIPQGFYSSGSTSIPSACVGVSNPAYSNLDWYRYIGPTTPTNEQLLVAPVLDFTTNVSTSGANTDTTINVVSTTGFPSAGWFFMDGELIQYTSTSGTSFIGCTRGKYNTMAVAPLAGAQICIAGWFIFMVDGLLFGGYQTPT